VRVSKRLASAVLAFVLALSLVAPALGGALAGSAAAAPSGMVTVSDSQITQEVPSGESIPVSAADLEGAVLASSGHADSLEVIATTPGHADEVMGTDANVVGGGQMALVFRDAEDHESREIAVDAGLLREALGYTPETVRGTHSSGETWRSEARYQDGSLVLTIESFSSNTVTFSGQVDVSLAGATNGTSAQWSLSDYDSASDVTINTTGQTNTEAEQIQATITDGGTVNADIAGSVAPGTTEINISGAGGDYHALYADNTGDSSDDWAKLASKDGNVHNTTFAHPGEGPKSYSTEAADLDGDGFREVPYISRDESLLAIDWTGEVTTILSSSQTGTQYLDQVGGIGDYDGDGDKDIAYGYSGDGWLRYTDLSGNTVNTTISFTDLIGPITDIDNDGSQELIASKSGAVTTVESDGTVTTLGGDPGWYLGGVADVDGDGDSDVLYTDGSTAKYVDTSGNVVSTGLGASSMGGAADIDGDGVAEYAIARSDGDLRFVSGSTIERNVTSTTRMIGAIYRTGAASNISVDVDGDGSADATPGPLYPNQTASRSVDLSLTDDVWDVSVTGRVTVSATISEVTQTTDPAIELNGNTTTLHSGTLADGETVQTTIPNSQLREGSNSVNVSMGDGSLSADAPDMQADIDLAHDASDQIEVSYQTTAFEETYNVSHTYADATADAQVTIPFASERIVEVAALEYRIDGGTWQSVSAQNYRLDGTTLDVYLSDAYGGDIPSGSTVDVRATGRRIDVANGAVTVTEATAPGDELDTQLRIDSRSPGFHVNVGPTANGERIHHATSSDYPTTDYAIIEADGDQRLYLPNSKTGDHFRVNYIQTMAMPEKGDVKITVEKAGSDPELDIDPGPMGAGDPVTYKYYRTTSGVEYILNSITQGVVRDSDVANSPAIFEDDDSDELLSIFAETSSSTGDGGGAGVWDQASSAVGSVQTPSLSVPSWLPIAGVLLLGGGAVVVVSRRVFGSSEPPTSPAEDPRSRPTGSSSSSSGGLVSRLLRGSGGLLVSVLTGSGRLLAWTTRRGGRLGLELLKLLNRAVVRVLANTYAAVLLAVGGFLFAGQLGLVPGRAITLGSVIGLLVATLWGLQQLGIYSNRLFLLIGGLVSVGAVELLSPGLLQQFVGQLPIALLAILATAILAVWFIFVRRTEASTPETVNRVLFRSGGGGSSDNSSDDGGLQ